MSAPLAIIGLGAVTPVGCTAPQTCAAVRAALSGFYVTELQIDEPLPGPLKGAPAPLPIPPHRSPMFERLVLLATQAISEGLKSVDCEPTKTALLLAIKEAIRTNPVLDGKLPKLIGDVQSSLGVRFHSASAVFPAGNAGGLSALSRGHELLVNQTVDTCIVAGVDSFLNRTDVKRFGGAFRLKSVEVTHGFIPGEAAACVVISRTKRPVVRLLAEVVGIGAAMEESDATVGGDGPATGRALQNAIQVALHDASIAESAIAFRVSDVNGETFRIAEMTLATQRVYRTRREHFPVIYPAGSVGEVGAAFVPLAIVLATSGIAHGYAPGDTAIIEASSDSGLRGACIVRHPARN